jgi:curli production assembly/transport component CsgG
MFFLTKRFIITVITVITSTSLVLSQDRDFKKEEKYFQKLSFYDFRGSNAIDAAIGTSVINGDFEDPQFEIYFRIGYKRFVNEHFSVNFSYNKYNLGFKGLPNQGFMSFDFNLEYLFNPYKRFSPFIAAGAGYNAANYFETTSTKAQGMLGLEYIVYDGLGVKLFAEYNYNFDDELDGLIKGESNDTFFRIGLGVNFYFGGNKRRQKLLSNVNTVINSNLIK